MIISAGGKNSKDIIDKILLLNESFEKLSKAYHQQNIEVPKLEDKKINYQKSEEIKYSIGVKDTYPQY